ncbi:MAG TPA: stage III sporulation protein AD [Clostridiales bacterium]|nr:stage III sporulation protein AD [Clostridiales bacterium]
MELSSIIAFALLSCVLGIILHQYKPEYSMLLVAAAGCILLFMLINTFLPAINEVGSIITKAGVKREYFAILLKALGICYITQFAGDLCRDSGQTSLAGKIDLAGKVAIVILALPIIKNIIEIVTEIIK